MSRQQPRIDQSKVFYVTQKYGGRLKTHEDKHSFGISFPTFHHILVLFTSPIKIHGEKRSGTIGKIGLSLRGLILRSPCNIWVVIYSGCSRCEKEKVELKSNNYLDLDHSSPGVETLK